MLQLRLKEGSDKRWFNPHRDIVNILPMLIKKSLMSFDEFNGVEGCTRDQLLDTARDIGKLVVHIIKNPVDHAEASKALLEIEGRCPIAFQLVSTRLAHVLVGAYTAFIADAKPKTLTDAELPTVGLEEIADQIARAAAKKLNDGSK
jgi:hypothetical protein